MSTKEFEWKPGINDAEYIKVLEESLNEWRRVNAEAMKKIQESIGLAQQLISERNMALEILMRNGHCLEAATIMSGSSANIKSEVEV